jgi:hypothetical protein
MLTQLIGLLESHEGSLSIAEISRALNAQPTAVTSMLDLLVMKGKLVEFGPDGNCCTVCAKQNECNLLVLLGKRYALAERVTHNVEK